MSQTTEDRGDQPFEHNIAAIEDQLSDLAEELAEWKTTLQRGEDAKTGDIKRTLTEVRQLVRLAAELEMKIAERDIRDHGLARAGHAIDFDAARAQIGCRLDRLRRCCRQGTVPGGADR